MTKPAYIVAGVALLLIASWVAKKEKFTPVYCSTRSDNCLDMGSREQTAYSSP